MGFFGVTDWQEFLVFLGSLKNLAVVFYDPSITIL